MTKDIQIPNDKDLRVGYYYCLKYRNGYTDALNKINPNLSEYFGMMGWIHIGIDGAGHGRFRLLDDGEKWMEMHYTLLVTKAFEKESTKKEKQPQDCTLQD